MKNITIGSMICMFVALSALPNPKTVAASPVLIDFESTGLSEGDPLTDQIPGMIFTGAIIAEEGSPLFAFYAPIADDTVLAGQPFGGFFITDPLVEGDAHVSGTIQVSFDIPVFDLSFRVADLDAWDGYRDVLTSKTFDARSTLLETVTITAGDAGTGDGIATLVEFSVSDISRLTITVATQRNRAGWGFDNLSFTPVPIPPGGWLFGSGLIALLGFRKKLRN